MNKKARKRALRTDFTQCLRRECDSTIGEEGRRLPSHDSNVYLGGYVGGGDVGGFVPGGFFGPP